MEAPPAVELTLLDRMVGGQIIGRHAELQRVRELWNKAGIGEGGTLLLSGEPGIGKTRLMREVVTQAEISGGQALLGACFPEGNGPYEAFQQIIRRAFRRNPDLLDDFHEFVMAKLLTLSPNLKVTYPDVPDNPPLEVQAQQQRLLESVVTFCRALSERTPLPLGTYREVELDQTLPFNQFLSDLNRERLAARLKIGRLSHEQTCQTLDTLFV
jgi:Cdc6-like AAA superfamily ATPase